MIFEAEVEISVERRNGGSTERVSCLPPSTSLWRVKRWSSSKRDPGSSPSATNVPAYLLGRSKQGSKDAKGTIGCGRACQRDGDFTSQSLCSQSERANCSIGQSEARQSGRWVRRCTVHLCCDWERRPKLVKTRCCAGCLLDTDIPVVNKNNFFLIQIHIPERSMRASPFKTAAYSHMSSELGPDRRVTTSELGHQSPRLALFSDNSTRTHTVAFSRRR